MVNGVSASNLFNKTWNLACPYGEKRNHEAYLVWQPKTREFLGSKKTTLLIVLKFEEFICTYFENTH